MLRKFSRGNLKSPPPLLRVAPVANRLARNPSRTCSTSSCSPPARPARPHRSRLSPRHCRLYFARRQHQHPQLLEHQGRVASAGGLHGAGDAVTARPAHRRNRSAVRTLGASTVEQAKTTLILQHVTDFDQFAKTVSEERARRVIETDSSDEGSQ